MAVWFGEGREGKAHRLDTSMSKAVSRHTLSLYMELISNRLAL